MKLFIYVFSEDVKQYLIKKGFTLLKEDPQNGIYVFKNEPDIDLYSLSSSTFALSDTLTF